MLASLNRTNPRPGYLKNAALQRMSAIEISCGSHSETLSGSTTNSVVRPPRNVRREFVAAHGRPVFAAPRYALRGATMACEPGSPLTLLVGNDPDELAALLPPRAGQRFEILTSRREDAHRLIPEGETVRQANAERFKAERHLHLLQAPASERGNSLPSDDIHCVVARRQLEKLTNAARVWQERYATRGRGFWR